MKIVHLMLLVLAICGPLPAAAQERLVSPVLEGFVTGYQAANADQSILEEVLQGETVEAWTAMVTTQRYAVAGASLAIFSDTFLANLRRACPRATFTERENFTHSGRPAVLFSADCPTSPATGAREQMTVLAISGAAALHIKQVAFRAGHKGETAWARDFLLGTRMCDADC